MRTASRYDTDPMMQRYTTLALNPGSTPPRGRVMLIHTFFKFFSQPTITSTSTPAPSNSSPDPAQSSGLSTGAKAGIGIGAAVCALSVAGFLLFVYRFKRRKGATKKLPPLPLYGLVKSELSANSERREVSADQLPQELEAAHMRPELPGDRGRNG